MSEFLGFDPLKKRSRTIKRRSIAEVQKDINETEKIIVGLKRKIALLPQRAFIESNQLQEWYENEAKKIREHFPEKIILKEQEGGSGKFRADIEISKGSAGGIDDNTVRNAVDDGLRKQGFQVKKISIKKR